MLAEIYFQILYLDSIYCHRSKSDIRDLMEVLRYSLLISIIDNHVGLILLRGVKLLFSRGRHRMFYIIQPTILAGKDAGGGGCIYTLVCTQEPYTTHLKPSSLV